MQRRPCTGAHGAIPHGTLHDGLSAETRIHAWRCPSRERPLVFSTERPALTRQCSRLSSYHVHRPACSSRSSPFLEAALRQLRWLRACRSKTNTNARSRIDRRPRVPRMRPITIHTRETNGTERPHLRSPDPDPRVGYGVAHVPAACLRSCDGLRTPMSRTIDSGSNRKMHETMRRTIRHNFRPIVGGNDRR